MKFSDMPYTRPDLTHIIKELGDLTQALADAPDFAAADTLFLQADMLEREIQTLASLSTIRHSIDTRDEFYDRESDFWNENRPLLAGALQDFTNALLASPFRAAFEEKYGSIVFVNAALQQRAFSPEIIPEMQKENALTNAYAKLIASAQVPFEGKTYTLSQMTTFKNDPDDDRRLAAWKAEGQWYKDKQEELDRIYDELVHLRDAMGKKLGHENYLPLGYDRMERNCYSKKDVEHFRAGVRKHIVPVAAELMRAQAERLGVSYPLSFSDAQLVFRSGNPRPAGDADDILKAAETFYDELSPETSVFFRSLIADGRLDVLSKEGKEAGGYCNGLPMYKAPFVFANFNGTQGDVDVMTHECGHAFAYHLNAERVPVSTCWPSMDGAEVHSMSMEYFAWPWASEFFGDDSRKYLYSHLAAGLKFIPYGTMVDHFQHRIYEQPDATPAERHAMWKELLGVYMPWIKLDGDIPVYGEGHGWQRQPHIYRTPLYYIDYCLAQTVALTFWRGIQEDADAAWQRYLRFTRQGGSAVFTELLANAGLASPFAETTLQEIAEAAASFLDAYDLQGLH